MASAAVGVVAREALDDRVVNAEVFLRTARIVEPDDQAAADDFIADAGIRRGDAQIQVVLIVGNLHGERVGAHRGQVTGPVFLMPVNGDGAGGGAARQVQFVRGEERQRKDGKGRRQESWGKSRFHVRAP